MQDISADCDAHFFRGRTVFVKSHLSFSYTTKIRFRAAKTTQKAYDSIRGFTSLELLILLCISAIVIDIAAVNLTNYVRLYRLSGDAHRIASELALARIRSAGDYDEARVTIDQTAGTFQLELCNKATNTFRIEDSALPLSPNISFGYGTGITQGPIASQTSVAQTAPVAFNSRGVPITLSGGSCTGCGGGCASTPTANNAIYLKNSQGVTYAITVNLGGKIDIWQYQRNAWNISSF